MSGVRLAIVDDALFVREALKRLLADEPRIEIVGQAATGEELLARLDEWRPDVVTLDLNMPGIGGLATLDRLMASNPLPVIILSTHSGQGAPVTVEALSRGAVDFIDKEAYSLVDFGALRSVLVEKLLHVVHARRDGARRPSGATTGEFAIAQSQSLELLVVGASTGGPRAIETVLRAFRTPPPFPVVVVQHMPPGFTRAFAERLNRILPVTVRECEADMPLPNGTVTIAPGTLHLRVERVRGGQFVGRLDAEPAEAVHRPSVDVLFESAVPMGAAVSAVLLTGMGSDGARGMERLHQAGAYTIAQDAATCVVYGMPRAAVERGATREVLPLEEIGPRLVALTEQARRHAEAAY